MIRFQKITILICLIALSLIGCNVISDTDDDGSVTNFYSKTHEQITYYEDESFLPQELEFDTVLNQTIKAFNEIKDDVKDLDTIIDIATDDLKAQAKFDELREQSVYGNNKKVNEEIKDYEITGVIYDIDQEIITVKIHIDTIHKHQEPTKQLMTVSNNQTYKYIIDHDTLRLMDYDLSFYVN